MQRPGPQAGNRQQPQRAPNQMAPVNANQQKLTN